MEIVDQKISDLRPAEYNPRQITKKQFEDLRRSIQEFGEMEPAIVNTYKGRENVIISGHQRIKVAADLGMEKWPCVLVKLPPKKEKELNIRMNKNTGEFDFDLLEQFEREDLEEWGFDFGINEDEEDFEIKEDKIKPYKKLHFLISVDPNDYLKIKDEIESIESKGVEIEKGAN